MTGAMAAVLAQYKVGATRDWKSATTGRAGKWTLTRTYQRDGMKCAQITHKFTAGPGFGYTAPMGQVPDGNWKLAFGSPPPGRPAGLLRPGGRTSRAARTPSPRPAERRPSDQPRLTPAAPPRTRPSLSR